MNIGEEFKRAMLEADDECSCDGCLQWRREHERASVTAAKVVACVFLLGGIALGFSLAAALLK